MDRSHTAKESRVRSPVLDCAGSARLEQNLIELWEAKLVTGLVLTVFSCKSQDEGNPSTGEEKLPDEK